MLVKRKEIQTTRIREEIPNNRNGQLEGKENKMGQKKATRHPISSLKR